MDSEKFKLELGGRELSLEVKDLAEQAAGSIFARYGDTVILATCCMSPTSASSRGFLPLTVDYEERYYAAGKIKGPRYIRRESRPSDKAILNARLIDRTIRPRFPQNLFREVQVVDTVLSWDGQNDPNVLGIIAASAALSLSNIPWRGPLAAVKIGRADNEFVLNPTAELEEKNEFQLVIAGDFVDDDQLIINMLEGEGSEVSEELVAGAVEFARPYLKKIIDFQKDIISRLGKAKSQIKESQIDPELISKVKEFLNGKIETVLFRPDRSLRQEQEEALKQGLAEFAKKEYPNQENGQNLSLLFDEEVDRVLTENVLKNGKRPDGRKPDELRPISCAVGVLPRTHGTGLFCRGQTKALSILTLGAPGDQQILEGMEITGKKHFMLHYNFPPYSVGEIKPMRGPGRREIGHGMLGERALLPVVPSTDEFPYTIRVVSEILSSNGSTSMASISGASLALMDAGVPIKSQVAGISIGLVMDEKTKKYALLTDIQGPEDHHGDMDFKAAGTRNGITVLQMDVKLDGITQEILTQALVQAKKARLEILDVTEKTIGEPRKELSPYAPRILTIQINPDKIREVVGPGGKVINEIVSQTGAIIDIGQSGLIFITSENEASAQKALEWIKNITHEAKVGETFNGKVSRLFNFGAMVEFLPGQEGLVHISELANYRVNKVEDIVKIGDVVPVKVVGIDEKGRVNLSLKQMSNEKDHGGETRLPQKGGN
ncbi:MAG: polyribonucleotide nucleotidyltransferase [Candidatus Wildermuthbacteria bacterium GWA2_46_15]|uniref:Polyribonucleotide nucleotidyltransferase n=1 Tax=Candidatus Wildermuthbacteria bacterium GWA2_46_15 TaxID=1802443 RepID=A0A1G2QSH7_9BACT|nr:MAG: polyribonucleotide nucleotidyltransferase [Candidatus Wildermuthbacteria bacterium GWA2_46_15]